MRSPSPPFVGLRNPVVREGKLCAWSRVVGRLSSIVAASESERVIEEWLQGLIQGEVGGERVVIRSARHDFTSGGQVFRQTGQRLGDVVAVLLQHRGHRV